jgi:hypothetical protein
MGNRSRYVAVTAAGATAAMVSARRRARLRRAMDSVRETILPTHVADLPTESVPEGDEAHAPGHRRLGGPRAERRRGPSATVVRRQFLPGMRNRTPDR